MTTEQKHEIDIPGLPKGWRAVEVMVDPMSCNYIGDDGYTYITAKIKIEKIKPRRIVLEEIDEIAPQIFSEGLVLYDSHKIWFVNTGHRTLCLDDRGGLCGTIVVKQTEQSRVVFFDYPLNYDFSLPIDEYQEIGAKMKELQEAGK